MGIDEGRFLQKHEVHFILKKKKKKMKEIKHESFMHFFLVVQKSELEQYSGHDFEMFAVNFYYFSRM